MYISKSLALWECGDIFLTQEIIENENIFEPVENPPPLRKVVKLSNPLLVTLHAFEVENGLPRTPVLDWQCLKCGMNNHEVWIQCLECKEPKGKATLRLLE